MNKEAIRGFIAWLDKATLNEIRERQVAALETQKRVSTREGLADARLALRLIDEELLARMESQPAQQR